MLCILLFLYRYIPCIRNLGNKFEAKAIGMSSGDPSPRVLDETVQFGVNKCRLLRVALICKKNINYCCFQLVFRQL